MYRGLFVSMSGPEPGVFDSQVLEYGSFLRTLGVDFRYLFFDGLQTWFRSGRQARALLSEMRKRFDAQIRLRYIPRPSSSLGVRQAAASVVREARTLSEGGCPILIQARGPLAARVALEARRIIRQAVILYDARGDEAAESRLEATQAKGDRRRLWWERRARRLEALERRASSNSDHILAISGPLRDHICRLGNVPRRSVTVVPCCANVQQFRFSESARIETRRHLQLEKRFVLVYSGSFSVWQLPELTAALVSRLRRFLPEVHLLLLSRDRQAASQFFGSLMKNNACTYVNSRHEEVNRYLSAADAGLLLREENEVNRVACPVKFAEYQVSGLPVILTRGIGDVSNDVRRTGYGVSLEIDASVEAMAQRLADAIYSGGWERARQEISDHAVGLYSREVYREAYAEILERLGLRAHENR